MNSTSSNQVSGTPSVLGSSGSNVGIVSSGGSVGGSVGCSVGGGSVTEGCVDSCVGGWVSAPVDSGGVVEGAVEHMASRITYCIPLSLMSIKGRAISFSS